MITSGALMISFPNCTVGTPSLNMIAIWPGSVISPLLNRQPSTGALLDVSEGPCCSEPVGSTMPPANHAMIEKGAAALGFNVEAEPGTATLVPNVRRPLVSIARGVLFIKGVEPAMIFGGLSAKS